MAVAAIAAGAWLPSPAAAYVTLADIEGSATPIVWSERPTVALDVTGLSADQGALVEEELRASIETWNAVECAETLLTFGGTDPATAAVVVRFVADWAEHGFEPTAAGTTDLVLASTMDGGAGGGAEIVSATVSLNGTFEWGSHPQEDASVRDLRVVLVHELGHVLGLAHSQDARATMAATYDPGQADLADDDVAGICALYATPPPPPPACQVEEPCAPGHWCIEGECRPDLRFGTECTDGSECIGARCVEVESGAGACTYVCESEDDCPSSTSCLPVEGRPMERVCAPIAPAAGCTVSGRSEPMPVAMLLPLVLAGALFGRRRAGRGAELALVLSSALTMSACSAAHEATDGGPDADATDAGEGLDAGPDEPDATAPPDTGPTPVCEPGQMDVAPCGFCGSQGRTCDAAGQWMATSECLGQGECAVGSVEARDIALCGQEQRLCLDGCSWGAWEYSRVPGECEPGDTRVSGDACSPGETRGETCSDACVWEGTSSCVAPCGVVARSTPDWAREVCVPAGPFYRGSTTYTDTQPVAEVYVSAFLIDAFPVTIRRYQQCVSAGLCTPSTHEGYSLPERADYPVQLLTRAQAEQFCTWDGGRRLPTEAQWEKAARGPSPRMNPFPWEGTSWDCSLVPSAGCGTPRDPRNWAATPYDGQPGTRSYYGTYLQIAGVPEFVVDYYSATFYADARSLSDPEFTESDGTWSMFGPRGAVRGSYLGSERELANRGVYTVYEDSGASMRLVDIGFRCARSAP